MGKNLITLSTLDTFKKAIEKNWLRRFKWLQNLISSKQEKFSIGKGLRLNDRNELETNIQRVVVNGEEIDIKREGTVELTIPELSHTLNETSTIKALGAEQGKVLEEKIKQNFSNSAKNALANILIRLGASDRDIMLLKSKFSGNPDVTGIELNLTETNISINGEIQLIATVFPLDAGIKDVVWISSDPNKLTVSDNGLVNCIGGMVGDEITIVAKTVDGEFTASCLIHIIENNMYE